MDTSPPVRVLIVYRTPLLRAIVEKFLETERGIESVGAVRSVEECRDLFLRHQPRVLVVEHAPGALAEEELAQFQRLTAESPAVRIIMVSLAEAGLWVFARYESYELDKPSLVRLVLGPNVGDAPVPEPGPAPGPGGA